MKPKHPRNLVSFFVLAASLVLAGCGSPISEVKPSDPNKKQSPSAFSESNTLSMNFKSYSDPRVEQYVQTIVKRNGLTESISILNNSYTVPKTERVKELVFWESAKKADQCSFDSQNLVVDYQTRQKGDLTWRSGSVPFVKAMPVGTAKIILAPEAEYKFTVNIENIGRCTNLSFSFYLETREVN